LASKSSNSFSNASITDASIENWTGFAFFGDVGTAAAAWGFGPEGGVEGLPPKSSLAGSSEEDLGAPKVPKTEVVVPEDGLTVASKSPGAFGVVAGGEEAG
jgi:hypothetical protein